VISTGHLILKNSEFQEAKWIGRTAGMSEKRNAYRILVRKPPGKRQLRRERRRWKDNIKMDLMEIDFDNGRWMELAQFPFQRRGLVIVVLNLWSLLP
jgi:hypothetical protein